jgi:peptide/nickel transport system ATP-binding protein
VVEIGPVDAIWARQAHPYTRSLFSAMPSMDPDNRTLQPPLTGDPPNPINPPPGCRFHTRCHHAAPVCALQVPRLRGLPQVPGHLAACHLNDPASGHPEVAEAAFT